MTDTPAPTLASEIRTAAEKLRALATAASTDGRRKNAPTARWHFKKRDNRGYIYSENPVGPGVRITPSTPASPGMRPEHGEYAATMDPTVGLLLADLLEDQADGDDQGEINPWALALARELNGGEQQ
ncbi:hypothetical protein AB0E62_34325 [Streptomyces sp. NPDC038707]|uniref:hypothetical protein n=1 Tax=Streptomyces sp. NPDC038707 TaxID=3154329 RepID=UPI0033C3DD3F